MGETPKIRYPVQIAFESLKDTFLIYALVADLITFIGFLVLLGTRFAPLWPYAAIVIVILLSITLITALVMFGRVVVEGQRSITDLQAQNRELHSKLTERVDRRVLIEAQLKNRFKEILERCGDCNKRCSECTDFFDFLRDNIFPFLVREFGFVRIGLSRVDESSDAFRFLFGYPEETKGQKHLAEFDQQASYIVRKGDTSKVTEVSYGKDFVAYFLPIQDVSTTDDAKPPASWYVFSFYLGGPKALANQELDYLNRELADEFRHAIKWIRAQEILRTLAQDVKHSHLCAVLLLRPDGKVEIDKSCDVLPASEITRISKMLNQEEINKALSYVLRRPSSDAEKPVIIPGGSYHLSLVPVLANNRVHRVVLFLDEAGGRPLISDQTRWHSLYRLANYLHSSVSEDEVTGLANKWFFERQANNLILYSERVLGLFVVSLEMLATPQVPTDDYTQMLQVAAGAFERWAVRGTMEPVLARYEGGVFLLLMEIDDRGHAYRFGQVIKDEIEAQLANQATGAPTVTVAAVVFSTPCGDWHSVLQEGFSGLQLAKNSGEGVYVAEQQGQETLADQ